MLRKSVEQKNLRRVGACHDLAAGVVDSLYQLVAITDPAGTGFKRHLIEPGSLLKIDKAVLNACGIETKVGLRADRFFASRQPERILHEMLRGVDVRIRRNGFSRHVRYPAFVDEVETLPVVDVVDIQVGD